MSDRMKDTERENQLLRAALIKSIATVADCRRELLLERQLHMETVELYYFDLQRGAFEEVKRNMQSDLADTWYEQYQAQIAELERQAGWREG